jgi:hypothetical protein
LGYGREAWQLESRLVSGSASAVLRTLFRRNRH